MKRKSLVALLLVLITFQLANVGFARVKGAVEEKTPSIYQSIGAANTTDVLMIRYQDSHAIEFQSNRSGDKNYYESFKVESKTDFQDYFRTDREWYDTLNVDFKDEKADADGNVHKKVIRIQDKYDYPSGQTYYSRNQWNLLRERIISSDSNKSGYLEFYFLSEATNGTFTLIFGDYDKKIESYQYNLDLVGYGIYFGITPIGNDTQSSFFTMTKWGDQPIKISNETYQPDKWYHVRLSFNFNSSWAIEINKNQVYNSSNWTFPSDVTNFDYISTHTQTKYKASYDETHIYYLDAIGLSYNVSQHNSKSTMKFNEEYEPYVNLTSKNNLNDHDIAGSLAVYFLFSAGDLFNRSTSYVLHFKGYFTSLPNYSVLKIYNQRDKNYDIYDENFNPIVEDLMLNYTFSSTDNRSINSTLYVGSDGTFNMKIEAETEHYFTLIVDYVILEFQVSAQTFDYFWILVFIGLAFIFVAVVLQIAKKGGYLKPSATSRKKKSRVPRGRKI
ncbi:MAG: hypothetical protein ACTSWN_16110 [Promethearchaeota archaeon]